MRSSNHLVSVISATLFTTSLYAARPATNLSPDKKELLSIIVASYNANLRMLESLYLEYDDSATYTEFPGLDRMLPADREKFTGITELNRRHTFAFSGQDRLYTKIDQDQSSTEYVRNGHDVHRITHKDGRNYRIIRKGSTKMRQLGQHPWRRFAFGLTAALNKFDPQYDKIGAIRKASQAGKTFIAIELHQRLKTDPSNEYNTTTTLTFSVADGYMPVRVRQETRKGPDRPSFWIETKVEDMLAFDVGGSMFYLPGKVTEKRYKAGTLSSTRNTVIDKKTIKINTELPDALFQVTIKPGDKVRDEATGLHVSDDL